MAAISVPKDEALILCALSKIGSPLDHWSGAGKNIWKMSFGLVCNPRRRGLIVELYASQGAGKMLNRKINFGLIDTIDSDWVRIYQLTIAPTHLPTHTEKGKVWSGAHEHMGYDAEQTPDLNDAAFSDGLAHFCERTKLRLEGLIPDPFLYQLSKS